MDGAATRARSPLSVQPGSRGRLLQPFLRFVRKKPLGAVGLLIILGLYAVAITGPWIAPMNPYELRPELALHPPDSRFILGTDGLGRDQFSRIIYGARVSMYVGLMASVGGSLTGGLLGVVSAYKGGAADSAIQRFMDVLMTFPTLALALAVVAALGPSLNNAVIAIAVPFIPRATRIVRAQALAVRETMYVDAARATGCSDARIMLLHMMPNCLAPWLIVLTVQLASAILVEASLSFLGLGIPPPEPSWGNMLTGAAAQFAETAPWLAIFPGVIITICVFGFNLFGDALRDVWDPKLRGS
ncbi:MAG: ABC transporter permease [Chloroflexi bacterium]|nr:ABC transporter permease [Chloroflexota bacterium]